MASFQLSHSRDTVRTHHQVDRAAWKRVAQPTGTSGNLEDRLIFNEHRHDDVARGAEIGDRRCNASTGLAEWHRRGGDHVEDREFVSGAENAPRHSLTHSAKTDETYLHVENL